MIFVKPPAKIGKDNLGPTSQIDPFEAFTLLKSQRGLTEPKKRVF